MPPVHSRRAAALVLLARLLLAGWLLAPTGARAQEPRAPDAGEVAPLFDAPDTTGARRSLSDLRRAGRPAVVFFWTLRSATSLREMAFLNELHRAWRDRGLLVLAVEAGRNDGPQIAEDLEKMRNIDLVPEFPILPDPRGSICDLFGVRAVPVTYILGKEGRILLRLTEFSDARKPTLEAAVEEAVTGRRPEASQAPAEGSGFPPLLPSSPAGLPEEAPSITRAAKARQEADAGRGEDLEKNRYFADFHYNRGEFDKAEGYYLKVVDIDPRNIEARLRLGDIFIKRKDRVRARQTWEEILRIDPRNAEAADYLRRLNRGDF